MSMKVIKPSLLSLSILALAGCASGPQYNCDIPSDCAPVHKNYSLATQDESPDGWVSDGAQGRVTDQASGGKEGDGKRSNRSRRSAGGSGEKGFFESWFDDPDEQPTRPVSHGERDVHNSQGPVFVPPEPHRIWLAHWKGDTGELNSGNYTYLTTPGYYLYMGERYKALPYGTVGKGSASVGGMDRATFQPVRPDDYGFDIKKRQKRGGVADDVTQPEVSN